MLVIPLPELKDLAGIATGVRNRRYRDREDRT